MHDLADATCSLACCGIRGERRRSYDCWRQQKILNTGSTTSILSTGGVNEPSGSTRVSPRTRLRRTRTPSSRTVVLSGLLLELAAVTVIQLERVASMPQLVELDRTTLSTGTTLILDGGSILDFKGDAIVNAANEGCVAGFGVDLAVNQAGGYELIEVR